MNDFKQLVELCRGRHIYIQTHNFPDPDAIASAFGLQRLLEHFDIQSTMCYDGRIDKLSASKMLDAFHLEMFSYEQLRNDLREEDYIICVDAQKHSGSITDFIGDEIACIDHHPTKVSVEYAYQEVRLTGSCATLIAQHYKQLGIIPEQDVATAMLYGLKMDTNQFSRGVTEEDIEIFAFLFPLCDQEVLTQLERNNMEFSDLEAYSSAIKNIQLYDKVGITNVDFPCPDAMIATLADFILALEEVEVAVVSTHRKDGIKISVRSEDPKVRANDLIHNALKGYGDGGGHADMAAGLIPAANIYLLGFAPGDIIRDALLKALPQT